MKENLYIENLRNDLKEFIFNRTDSVESITDTSEEYKKLSNTLSDLFNKIYELLGENGQSLLQQYEIKQNELSSLSFNSIYKQGFKDGMNIKNI